MYVPFDSGLSNQLKINKKYLDKHVSGSKKADCRIAIKGRWMDCI